MPNFLDAPEILPLPSLQAYSSISFLFLSCSLYYAYQITSEPDWKSNSSYAFQNHALAKNLTDEFGNSIINGSAFNETLPRINYFISFLEQHNASLMFNDMLENPHFLRAFDISYIMIHEPLCVWTLINIGYCLLILLGKVIQKLIFGDLRASEQQLLRDKFWNFLIYKFIFVFSVINVQYMDELVLWCSWFSVLGFMLVLTFLCKERFNYLTFSPAVSKWVHFRLLSLLLVILSSTIPLFGIGIIVGLSTNFSIGVFLISECLLLLLRTIYCVIQYMIHLWDINRESIWEKRASINYYIELIFDLLILSIEFAHHLHMLFWGNIILSVSSLVIVVQLRSIFNDINRRIKKHKNYLQVLNLMEEHFPVASDEELSRNNDDCAICWDHMTAARKLPCGHLFHTTCLRSWLEQDTSCPTCRHSLRNQQEDEVNDINPEGENNGDGRGLFGNANNAIQFTNHFFHFDGSRYARWLPSVSVEVTRPNVININASLNRNDFTPDFGQQQMEFMGQQVLEWFPQISMSTILEDLRVTRSVEHTIENILDGRLRQSTSSASSDSQTAFSSNSSAPTESVISHEDLIEETISFEEMVEANDDNFQIDNFSDSPQSTTFPVHSDTVITNDNNTFVSKSDSAETSVASNTTFIETPFIKSTYEESKNLLSIRKEEMLQKARIELSQSSNESSSKSDNSSTSQ